VLSAPALIFGEDAHAPMHVAHEMGTFGVALGIGLVMAAWRTERAVGMLPFAGVLALTLAVTATIDVAAARRTLTEELPHLIDMVALMGLWVVARRAREAHTVADRGARWPALA
jgi:predicted anti-sigma-YlaC factor YlaD